MRNYVGVPGSNLKSARVIVYLLVAAMALGLGLSLVSAAQSAPLQQTGGGKITGAVTNGNAAAKGVAVELRQRTNSGQDTLLASTTTDLAGSYVFTNQPSAAGDAFYYIRFTGGSGTLTSWYTFPIIYLTGSDFSVPSVDLEDVALVSPVQGATIPPGSTIQWKARRAGETYRLFIYTEGNTDKALLDSGSLGAGTAYTIPDGSLAEGKYEAIVQVRDTVVGYGLSRSHFHFTVGKPAAVSAPSQGQGAGSPPVAQPTTPSSVGQALSTVTVGSVGTVGAVSSPTASQPNTAPAQITEPVQATQPPAPTVTVQPAPPTATAQPTTEPAPPTATTAPTTAPTKEPAPPTPTTKAAGASGSEAVPTADVGKPELKLHLTADKTQVDKGSSLVYTIEISNNGDAAASSVVVTDRLPGGVSVDSSKANSTFGSVVVAGNIVTVQMTTLAPSASAIVSIPVQVNDAGAPNLSNQASAVYNGSSDPVQSNSYVAQVADPLTGDPGQGQATQQPIATPQPTAQSPSAGSNGSGTGASTGAPTQNPTPNPVAKTIPQTGGSFPLAAAILLLAVALVARYLRGARYRRD